MRVIAIASLLGVVVAVAFAGVRGWKAFQKLKPRDLINILYFYGLILSTAARNSVLAPTEKPPQTMHGSPSISSASPHGQPIRRGQSLPSKPVARKHAPHLSVGSSTPNPSPKTTQSATFSALKKSTLQRNTLVEVDETEVVRAKSEPVYLQVLHGMGAPAVLLTPPTMVKGATKTQPASALVLETKTVGRSATVSSLDDSDTKKTSRFRGFSAKFLKKAETKT